MWQPGGAHGDREKALLGPSTRRMLHQNADISCVSRVCSPEATPARLLQAIAIYHKNKIEFGPAKAANAGGVAVSGLEMAQNSARLSWSKEEVDDKLKSIMKSIFNASKEVRPTDLSWSAPVGLHCMTMQAGPGPAAQEQISLQSWLWHHLTVLRAGRSSHWLFTLLERGLRSSIAC